MTNINIRRLGSTGKSEDITACVAVHKAAFSTALMTRLGEGFLSRYYARVLNSGLGVALLAESEGTPQGFAIGFLNPAEFYIQMKDGKWGFAASMASSLLRRPWLLRDVITNYLWAGESDHAGSDTCELASIAVLPEASGEGLGQMLLDAFIKAAADDGAKTITLTTDAHNNARVRRFYEKFGFEDGGLTGGRTRPMVRYSYAIR